MNPTPFLRVLFAASEAHPIVKTGGLADVAEGLPAALGRRGLDVRVVLPAYRGWRDTVGAVRELATVRVLERSFVVHEARRADARRTLWLLDCPELFDRPGTPYENEHGQAWPDNGIRFGLFARAVARLATEAAATGFAPDVVHANDWHTGLVMPWLREHAPRPAGVFTIHNLAYQGVFPAAEARALQLPASWWHLDGVEYHGELSHLKAGIAYADAVTTVSPTHAHEIQRPEFGFGLDGLLRARSERVHGILNGIDEHTWNPATDPHLAARYDAGSIDSGKQVNRAALCRELGLADARGALLVGVIARFAHQKGADLLPAAFAATRGLPLQFAVLGRGEPAMQQALAAWAAAQPGQVALRIAHDEALAHRILAGADIFLMPSRYEPCGLTQMYSQRYGTVPVVRRTGGLVDTVTDATPEALRDGSATGVQFADADAEGIAWGLRRALDLRASEHWRALQQTGMRRHFSWDRAAGAYVDLYRSLAGSAGPRSRAA